VLTLLAEAPGLHVDALLVRARQLRDELDVAGVAQREQQLRDERSIRRYRRPNGLSRYVIDPDIETAAFLDDLYDRATSPRRGSVTFQSDEDRAWADAVSRDSRTTDQYVHDTIIDLLRLAVGNDSPTTRLLIGSRQPAVRVLVSAVALDSALCSPPGMEDASSPAATGRPAGPKRTTSTTGSAITVEQTSTAVCCCADITTCSRTTTVGRS